MEHFPYASPADTATCEDGDCSCSKEPLEPGSGYLYINNQVVLQRKNGTASEAAAAPMLLCREAARRRDLDLEVAAQDAAHWWETGSVVLRASPRRELKFEDFKGESVEQAQQLARQALGDELLGTDVVKDVAESSVSAQGRSADEAVASVMTRIPKDSFDSQPAEIIQEGHSGEVEIAEHDESDARRAWRRHGSRGAQLDALECIQTPKNGFAGLGKRPGKWIARWSAPFIAEISFKRLAVVSARYFS